MSIQKIADASLAWSSSSIRGADTSSSQVSVNVAKNDTSSAAQVDKASKTEKSQNASDQDTQQAAAAMQEFIQPLNNTLKFGVDKDSGQTVVKVVDTSTNTVIKQIPSEEAVALAKALDKLKGLLVQQKA